jgi:hypothetical protein
VADALCTCALSCAPGLLGPMLAAHGAQLLFH